MLRKTVINENQRGLLFKNGSFVKMLSPGRYFRSGNSVIELVDIAQHLFSERCTLETLLGKPELREHLSVVEVGDEEIALHYVNGVFSSIICRGKYAFWNDVDRHEFTMVDVSSPELGNKIPEYVFSRIPSSYYIKVEVQEYQRARLFINKKLVRILDSGTYYFWRTAQKVETDYVDTRLTCMELSGQEILTMDKVAIRVNFVCNYRITDYVKVLTEIDDYREQLRIAAQLALRDYVGCHKLDEILENKAQLCTFVYDKLKAMEEGLYVEIRDAGVKDIILPGEIRAIMNTVLIAEKQAQANVIARREEVASTRSLLNTAKLMDENKTLYKLKELEYAERICANVGNIELHGGDILSQLTGILRANT